MPLTAPPSAPPAAPAAPGDAPSRANPSSFRTLADAFVVWLVGLRTSMADWRTWMVSYLSWQTTNIAELAALQADVASKQSTASSAASTAATASSAAVAAAAAAKHIYAGTFASDPTLRPDGTAIQTGDEYFNSTANLTRRYNGATWVASDINTANLAAGTGAQLIGWGTATVSEALHAAVSVVAKVSEGKTAAQNATEIQAAHADLAGTGGFIDLPVGVFQVSGGLDISAGRADALGNQSVIFRGKGMGGTKLVMNNTTGALFTKSGGHAHAFRDLSLIGPGVGTSAMGVDWQNAAGGALWSNVWLQGFGIGSRFLDATSMTFENCHWHANGDNIELGFNCDLFQFYGGRIQNATGSGILIGYYDAGHPSGALNCSPINFNGVRFGANTRALKVLDTRAEQIVFDKCYFENNTQIAVLGEVGVAQTTQNLTYDHCFFTVLNNALVQIECLENTSNASIAFKHCSQDDSAYAGTFAQVGTFSSVLWERNRFPVGAAGRHVKIGTAGVSHIIKDQTTWRYNENVMDHADGALQATAVPARHLKMTTGTGKTWQKWSRHSSSTDAELGVASAEIADVNGQFVLYRGAVRVATPSGVPAADANYRGVMIYREGAAGVADALWCCMKDSSNAYSWKVVATG